MIQFQWYPFHELSGSQVYDLLKLRSEVFVVEQKILYLDADGKDFTATHLLGTLNDGTLAAYLRLLPSEDGRIYFGRVITAKSVRGCGYGKRLLQELIHYCQINHPQLEIRCSAQAHLQHFYGYFGFKPFGDVYIEEEIPHIGMRLSI